MRRALEVMLHRFAEERERTMLDRSVTSNYNQSIESAPKLGVRSVSISGRSGRSTAGLYCRSFPLIDYISSLLAFIY